ncbi:MAG TPA: twin-arginine translocase subunit TatB [Candidatus Hydrogenedentes bacterium]|nr:twin-arginine translocase subunit TatB [Candidatus Hydrogenedentota bacterium]
MLGIGPWEMVVIVGIALVVIGPERFPEFAKIVMRTIRDLRGYVSDVKSDIASELRPVKKEIEDLRRYDPEVYLDAVAGTTYEDKPYEVNGGDQAESEDQHSEPDPYEDAGSSEEGGANEPGQSGDHNGQP